MKALIVAIIYFGSVSVWAADPRCEDRGSNAFKFEWIPEDRDTAQVGNVIVTDARTGETVQVLKGAENHYGNNDALRLVDLNNDGCADLMVLGGVAPIGNETNTVYLYDRKRRGFVYNEELSAIGGLDIDRRNKNCVVGFWKGGAADISTSQYCWDNGKLFKKKEYSVSPHFKDGVFKCYMHVRTTFENGRKKTQKSCSKEL